VVSLAEFEEEEEEEALSSVEKNAFRCFMLLILAPVEFRLPPLKVEVEFVTVEVEEEEFGRLRRRLASLVPLEVGLDALGGPLLLKVEVGVELELEGKLWRRPVSLGLDALGDPEGFLFGLAGAT
jgi:hypothetical protein